MRIDMPEYIPPLTVEAPSLPEAWEKSLIALRKHGIPSRKESYTDPSGVDEIIEASMMVVIKNPLQEPMLHRGCEGLMMLEQYVEEVLEGVKDSYIGDYWDYTYHQRLYEYEASNNSRVDQIQYTLEKLRESSFSNRAQATTWMPWKDSSIKGPPCLQRIWCKVVSDKYLEMHAIWRSRDAYNAAFMNMYALIHLQKNLAEKIGVKVGQYIDFSDSYHVYKRNYGQLDKFIDSVERLRKAGKTPWMHSKLLEKFRKSSQQ